MKKIVGLIASSLLSATAAQAEQQFYSTQLWDVSLHDAGYDDGMPVSHQPTCDLTSMLWADRKIVFEYSIVDEQTGAYTVLIQKKTWHLTQPSDLKKLPVVTLSTLLGDSALPYPVLAPDTLAATLKTDANLNFDLQKLDSRLKSSKMSQEQQGTAAMSILNFIAMPDKIFGAQGRPSGITVTFQGNEQPWTYPESTPYDARALSQAFTACKLALISKASEQTSPGAATSPMPDSEDESQQPPTNDDVPNSPLPNASQTAPNPLLSKQPPQPSDSGASTGGNTTQQSVEPKPDSNASTKSEDFDSWRFSSGDEDWGKTCFVEASSGDKKVGFMAAPGKNMVAYVDGVFNKDTQATWRVDDQKPYASDGGVSDYFGWMEFDDLPQQLLGDVASGQHVLQITPTTGSKLVVRLTGASAAISAFNACFKAEGSSTPSSQDSGNAAISPSSQQRKSCLLELKGKKFIDGKCAYWSDGDSGFQIDAGGYFAQVMLDDPTHATATWNETKDSTHAQTELGRLTKQGDCWANTEAKICAK
jgi:hypothetical protein